ncbi:uncharacterized protein [Panulirus ornatus]|uniref:uncharacterized protein n=1 Tax=Panulirus ornatus TaxID=150431 RepID=UPI003A8B27CE
MDDVPETRRRIGIIVAQSYRESRHHVQFSRVTPDDSTVTFPAYPDHSFQHLRKLHEKGIQAVVEVVEGTCQTEVRIPWSRWVETTPPEPPDIDAPTPEISQEVLDRVEEAVKETSTVDVLNDDWGQLGLVDRSAALLLKPFTIPSRATSTVAPATKEEVEDEDEEDEEPSSPDILKLQMLQRKMMRRIHERRAAAAAAESPLQRFLRHYHARLRDLYPEEALALEGSLGQRAEAPPVDGDGRPKTEPSSDGEGSVEL